MGKTSLFFWKQLSYTEERSVKKKKPMKARIYKPSRHTMQVGRAKTKQWVLDYSPSGNRFVEPLMAWTTTEQTQTQLRLTFPTKETAIAYAERNKISYTVIPEQKPIQQPKNYADNFAHNRLR